MDLAASIQAVTDEVVLRLTRSLSTETGLRNLCLAGGVALNCVANGKVFCDGRFDRIFIQPAAGDAGGALGAALAVYHAENHRSERNSGTRQPDAMQGAYLGPAYEQTDIERRLSESGAVFDVVDDAALIACPPGRRLVITTDAIVAGVHYLPDDPPDLVARKLLSEVELPEPDSGPWEDRLRAVVTGIDARLHDHPGIATVMLERMRSTDRRLMNGIFEILLSAGFQGADVFLSYAMIHTYLFGRYQVMELDDPDPGDLEDTLATLVPHLAGLRGRDFFTYGVDTIIEGLRAQLASKPKRTRRAPR